MHLLKLKRLMLHLTNPLVNLALKFNFMQFQVLKVETQSV